MGINTSGVLTAILLLIIVMVVCYYVLKLFQIKNPKYYSSRDDAESKPLIMST
tara:strand:- start:216 stop:374 length:159 start_codon:yes stop_codon:yes gene_type:complete